MEIFKILGTIAHNGAGSKLDKLKGIASKLGDGVKAAGKAFAGLSTAVGGIAVAVGAASVKMGAAFDSQMSTVQSISGATAEEFEMLRAKAQEMGATTSFSATESAQALEYMAMAGWDTQQMTDGLAGVMNLAAASGEDLATTSDIVTDAMTAFGMEAEKSEYFSDVLAKTASSANTNVSMMGETFKYIAPLAGAMGYNIGHCDNCSCGLECLSELKNYISYGSSGDIACLIIEPILGNGGNQVPPQAYFKDLRKICDENDIVLIFDEIQTGVGRTGKMYAAQYFDVKPNIITTAKGLGGTGFQIAGILMEEKFNKMESFLHSFTYGTNILSVTAALKTLNIIDNEDFLNNVTACGEYIMNRLKKMQDKYIFIGDVRGVGLMIGFEIVKDRKTRESDRDLTLKIVHRALEDYGLMLRSSLYGFGNVLKIRPALNITMQQCEEMMNVLDECLASFNH